jgi:energy-coupling factor transporter ATP-binding protein EcfA2
MPKLPYLRIKKIHIKNFQTYEDYTLDFTDKNGKAKQFICFVGSNGTGKSTALNIIQLLMGDKFGDNAERIAANLYKYIRNTNTITFDAVNKADNFNLLAEFESKNGDYEVEIDKDGFQQKHPKAFVNCLSRLCYFARFDQELHQFQLHKDYWPNFKMLFETVTGYEIHEYKNVFGLGTSSTDRLKDYILGFHVDKGHDLISFQDCSKGERKVIKSFSTLLNMEIKPMILLVDDIAMHVAIDRHLALIDAMSECYPNTQIISTAHSQRITKCLDKSEFIYDLRAVHAPDIFSQNQWRFRIQDEIEDAIYKLKGLISTFNSIGTKVGEDGHVSIADLIETGNLLRAFCSKPIKDLRVFENDVENFLKDTASLYARCVIAVG